MRTMRMTLASMTIFALTVGTTGVAVAQAEATEDAVPAAVSEPPTPSFPTGYFVSVENEHLMLEFEGDGTGVKHDLNGRTTSFTYALEGDVYTWLTSEHGKEELYGQATYAWDHDGGRLAFELLGEDRFDYRKRLYTENTYELAEDPQVVLVARQNLGIGDGILARRAFVPAVDVGPGAYTSFQDLLGYVVAVPVPEGQPITPDLLVPMPE